VKTREKILNLLSRIFPPGIINIVKSLEEWRVDFRKNRESIDPSLYINVEDNGSDTTVISVAGGALLYAGMPTFEFRKTLQSLGGHYNFVWVRDIHRTNYKVAPDGSLNGFDFYAKIVGDALSSLRSSRNIAIGSSGGGGAAIALSGLLPIDRVIAFNPVFREGEYGSLKNIGKVLLDLRKLLPKPRPYIEGIIVTLSARPFWKRLCRLVGKENIPDVLEHYLRKNSPTQVVIFYSQNCTPDIEQAMIFKDIPTVTLKPILSKQHTFMVELKQRGELGPLIHEEILRELPRGPSSSLSP
jgi:hypothetical protein